MFEKYGNIFGKITEATGKMASSVVSESTSLTLKTLGKTCGYAERGVSSVYQGTKNLMTFEKKIPRTPRPPKENNAEASAPPLSQTIKKTISKKKHFGVGEEIGKSFSRAKGLFTGGLRKKFGLNKAEVKSRITVLENSIRDGYLEVGKIGAEISDKNKLFDDPKIKDLVAQIEAYEAEIVSMKRYLTKLEEAEKGNAPAESVPFESDSNHEHDKLKKRIQGFVSDCLRRAKFTLKSDEIVFRKAMSDLLDDEIDIKRLAVSEIGKMGVKVAAPALKEALKFGDPQLQAEIINSLVRLEDSDIFNICRNYIQHEHPSVRAACIRGMYKFGRKEAVPYLIEALRDDSVEVRNSSAMFLGWLEAKTSVPPLLQAASDVDKRVRKSAIMSLSNIGDEASVFSMIRLLDTDDSETQGLLVKAIERIIGQTIIFNVGADPVERAKSVDTLKDWWIAKRHTINEAPTAAPVSDAPTPATSDGGAADTKSTGGQGS